MIDTHCPHCDADIEKRLMNLVFDGAGLYFPYTCECGTVLDIEVQTYIEFDIKPHKQESPLCQKTQ